MEQNPKCKQKPYPLVGIIGRASTTASPCTGCMQDHGQGPGRKT